MAAEKKNYKMGLADSVDLLSREDRSGINGRGGAKCSCLREVVDNNMNANVNVNGIRRQIGPGSQIGELRHVGGEDVPVGLSNAVARPAPVDSSEVKWAV